MYVLEYNFKKKSFFFMSSLHVDVFIVGGAAAGLSLASCLLEVGIDNIIVAEKFPRCGDQWRNRYHRLHLHDIKRECNLPYFPMPEEYPCYPSRLEYANYLDLYAKKRNIPVFCSHTVESATFNEDKNLWEITVFDTERDVKKNFTSNQLVIANGVYNDPNIPTIQGESNFKGLVRIILSSIIMIYEV